MRTFFILHPFLISVLSTLPVNINHKDQPKVLFYISASDCVSSFRSYGKISESIEELNVKQELMVAGISEFELPYFAKHHNIQLTGKQVTLLNHHQYGIASLLMVINNSDTTKYPLTQFWTHREEIISRLVQN